jgi:nitroreductase
MDFSEVLKNRYSVRKFSDEEVPQELINEILEAGRVAPSAGNHQPTIVYILDKNKIEKLNEVPSAKTHPVVFAAKQALLICYDKNMEMKRPHDKFAFGITDSSIVTTYMMLKITELGLGSVWVGWFNPKIIKEILEIPEEYEVSAILPFGYIQKGSHPSANSRKRKPVGEFRIDSP